MSVLDLLDDYRVTRVSLQQKDGRHVTLDCVARTVDPPLFELTFLPGLLPVDELDLEARVQLTIEVGGGNHSIEARIDEVLSDTRLQMVELESFTHVQKRSYFRVDTRTRVNFCPLTEEQMPSDEQEMTVNSLINLSGGGIRLPVPTLLPLEQRVQLDIKLDGHRQAVRCFGRVVRAFEADDEEPLQIALEFDEIEPEVRDAIMAHCFSEQRKQLRFKVSL